MLDNTIDSGKSKPGQKVSAKLRQEVPLPDGAKIKRGSRVLGHVVAVSSASSGHKASLTIQFDHIEVENQVVPISIGLSARSPQCNWSLGPSGPQTPTAALELWSGTGI